MIHTNFIKRLAVDLPLLNANHLAFMLTRQRGDDVNMAEPELFKKIRGQLEPKMERVKNIAIVPVQGVLAYNPDLMELIHDGVEDSRAVLKTLNEAADDESIEGVLLRMDSPGGMMLGGPEMADAVAAMKTKKPVIAHIGGLGASLGYMIASQATEVIANRSAIVGSIGVIASVTDYTALLEKIGIKFEYFTNKEAKFKAAGAMGTSLSEDQRTQLQSSVDGAFQVFKGAVLSARPGVPESAMQGQTYRGAEAKSVGLVDRVGTESFALSVLKSYMKN
jgi:signal peptide peptidase SppA